MAAKKCPIAKWPAVEGEGPSPAAEGRDPPGRLAASFHQEMLDLDHPYFFGGPAPREKSVGIQAQVPFEGRVRFGFHPLDGIGARRLGLVPPIRSRASRGREASREG